MATLSQGQVAEVMVDLSALDTKIDALRDTLKVSEKAVAELSRRIASISRHLDSPEMHRIIAENEERKREIESAIKHLRGGHCGDEDSDPEVEFDPAWSRIDDAR